MNPEGSSDAARLLALQAGDEQAFAQLVAEMQRPLFAFAWRYIHNAADAEDLVIATFVRLHQARNRLRPDTKLSAWLFTTLANLCHNHHRWRQRHPEVALDAPADSTGEAKPPSHQPIAATPAPGVALEQDEAVAALRSAIDRLSADHRTVVLLHHYEHLSYREIGAIVGCSERGVETRLYRARQQLKIELYGHLRETIAS